MIEGLPDVTEAQRRVQNLMGYRNSGRMQGGKHSVLKSMRILRRQLKVDALPLAPHLKPLVQMRRKRSMRKLSRNYVPAPHTNRLTRPE